MAFDRTKFANGFRAFLRAQKTPLKQVLPRSAVFDGVDCSTRYAVIFCYFGVASVVGSNFYNVFFGKFGVRGFTVRVAFMVDHILRVVCVCARKQMGRIDARRVIANEMANKFVGYVFAGCKLIHQSVRQMKRTLKKDTSVAVLICSARPKPTVVSFLDM